MAVNKESRFCPHNDVVTVVKPLGDVNYTMALQTESISRDTGHYFI